MIFIRREKSKAPPVTRRDRWTTRKFKGCATRPFTSPKTPSSAPDPEPSSPVAIEKAVRSSWHLSGPTRSIPGTQNPNQERQCETSADYYILALRNRHRRSKVRQEESAPGDPQSVVEEASAGHRTSSATDNESQFASGLHGHIILEPSLRRPRTIRRQSI
jgi:hypothetical protein